MELSVFELTESELTVFDSGTWLTDFNLTALTVFEK